MDTATVARLQELLDVKDREMQELEEENDALRRQLDFGIDWMRHQYVPAAEDVLPAPRIEMHITEGANCYLETQVTLVLPQRRDSQLARIPLAYSKRSGRALDDEAYPVDGEVPERLIAELPNLVNEACFFMEKTGVPAFVVLDELRKYRITSLRPLRMAAEPSPG